MDRTQTKKKTGVHWLIEGLVWGMVMFFMMEVLLPLATNAGYRMPKLLFSFGFWVIGGLCYGGLVQLFRTRYVKNKKV